MNRDLELGMAEGEHRMIVKDRGGIVESATWEARRDLSDTYHGLHECPVMHTPDALTTVNPYHVDNPNTLVDPESF
jgi:hypothetical protein